MICHDSMQKCIQVRVHMHVTNPFVRYSNGWARYI